MFKRILNPLESSSFFLFGARSTGKSTFIQQKFGDKATYIDLLDPALEDRLARSPNDIKLLISNQPSEWVIIDEVQKVPRLLDIIHQQISYSKTKFILTGSSARKLNRGAANLLAGRAFVYHFFPLTFLEIDEKFVLEDVLQYGSLPRILSMNSHRERRTFLQSYALTYIKEEIAAEQIIRRIDPFRNFLRIAAEQSGKLINHSSIAKQLGVDHKTVLNYFSILEDTLLGFYLPSFHQSVRKSQIVAPKFFLFDLGVRNALAEMIDLAPTQRSSYYGVLFEHYIILESFRLNSYSESGYRLSYLLTSAGFEIDLILSKGKKNIFVEIKSTDQIDTAEVEALARKLSDVKFASEIVYVSRDEVCSEVAGVKCLHWRVFLREYFAFTVD